MLGSYIKRLIREVQGESVNSVDSGVMSTLRDTVPTVIAFRINNGYVVRVHNPSVEYHSSGFTYCNDAQAIAEHIVASAMKDKLGVQSDMFDKEKHAAMAQHAISRGVRTAITRP